MLYEALVLRAVKPPNPPEVDVIGRGARGSGSVGAVGRSIGSGGGEGVRGGALGCVRVATWTDGHIFHLPETFISPSDLSRGRVDPGRKDPLPSTNTSKSDAQ